MSLLLKINILNTLKMKFDDPALENDYLIDYAKNLRGQSLFALSLALVLYLLFGYLDLYIAPEHVLYIWTIRTVVITLFFFMLVAITSKYFIEYNQHILTLAALICMGGLIMIFIPLSTESEIHYYVALTLVISWLYVSLGIRTKNALYLNIFLLFIYNLEATIFKDYPFYITLNNNYFLICLSILSLTGGYLIEKNRRSAFSKAYSLNNLIKKAELSNASKTRFLAAASHDLRQPLQAISLFLDVLNDSIQIKEQSEIIKKIKNSSASLESLLESLLDISKLDADIIDVKNAPFKLQNLFSLLKDEFHPIAENKNLNITFLPTSLMVDSDVQILERILRNLISNAINYTHEGRILVGCRRTTRTVIISVYDTGIGISSDDSDIIFEEFHQLDNPGRDRTKGLGLGLAIVKRLSSLLGAKLKHQSVLGKGTKFSIELPRASVNKE